MSTHQSSVKNAVLQAGILITAIPDLPKVIEEARRALELGPFLDPTAWQHKHRALEEDIETLEAALPLWRHGKKLEALLAEQRAAKESEGDGGTQEDPGGR